MANKLFLDIKNTPPFDLERLQKICSNTTTKTLLKYLARVESTVQDAACSYVKSQTAETFHTYKDSINWLIALNKEASIKISRKKNFLMRYKRNIQYIKLRKKVDQQYSYFVSCEKQWLEHLHSKQKEQQIQSSKKEQTNDQQYVRAIFKKHPQLKTLSDAKWSGRVVSEGTLVLQYGVTRELQERKQTSTDHSVVSNVR